MFERFQLDHSKIVATNPDNTSQFQTVVEVKATSEHSIMSGKRTTIYRSPTTGSASPTLAPWHKFLISIGAYRNNAQANHQSSKHMFQSRLFMFTLTNIILYRRTRTSSICTCHERPAYQSLRPVRKRPRTHEAAAGQERK